jgi:predicted nucleic acid-binding protein
VIGAILDTDVFSIIIEERPRAEKFSSLVLGVETALAFPSVAELTHGAHRAGWGAARREWLEAHIARHGLLMPTEDLLRLWGSYGRKLAGSATLLASSCPATTCG